MLFNRESGFFSQNNDSLFAPAADLTHVLADHSDQYKSGLADRAKKKT